MSKHTLQTDILYLFLLGLSLNPFSIFSQQRLYTNQEHYGVEDGLPQSYITGIVQDEDGFIWLSTLDGFCRYDGRDFKTFRYNPKDSTGLSANTLNGLGKITNNNVTIYYSPTHADEFNFRTFITKPNVARNYLSTLPLRWQSYRFNYSSDNWFYYKPEKNEIGWYHNPSQKLHTITAANEILRYDSLCAITETTNGRFIIVYKNGVQISDTSKTSFTWHCFTTGLQPDWTNFCYDHFGNKFTFIAYRNNKIASLEKDKLTLLDPNKKIAKNIFLPQPKPESIKGNTDLKVDKHGRAYFEYYGSIYRINEKDTVELLWQNTGQPARVSAFFIDRSDVLWISLNAQGLLRIDLHALNFESYSYQTSLLEDIFRLSDGVPGYFPTEWKDPTTSYFFRQTRDSKGMLYACNMWTETSDIFYFDQGKFQLFKHIPKQKIFSAVVVLPGDEIWGFDHSESVWYSWSDHNAIPQKIHLNVPEFSGNYITDVQYVGGYIWIVTSNNGLFQFDRNILVNKFSGRFKQQHIPNTLTEICADPKDKNKFWMGSHGGGLLLWDVNKGLIRSYTMDDGLPNNTIYCILPDEKGNLWCSTNKGIFRFNPSTEEIISFVKTDGLAGNEFNRAHKFKFPDGRLLFGGLDGYTIINPKKFDVIKPVGAVPVLLTGLQINNEPQEYHLKNSFIREPLSMVSMIELPHHKNYLRFEFAALLYNQPRKTKYRHQLKGSDKGWIENGYSNVASYSALPPGNYILRINATDENGIWSEEITEIKIKINPPFYATWWAWLIYAAILLLLVRLYLRFRERQIKINQNLAFEKREALRLKEVDEMKDRFFSNITHEFRTPLTLIISPLEKLAQDNSLSSAAIHSVKTAQRNAQQLLRLINEFLDFSKINHGQLRLKQAAGEVSVFTENCVASFELAAKEKNIDLQFYSENVAGYYLFDEEKWEKIVTNLVGNAMKFTPVDGKVSVRLTSEKENIHFEVKDSGPGIPTHLHQKIFTRFFQVDDSALRSYGGTGIGLSLVKELTELMQGSIVLDSVPDVYTKFVVSIPMQKVNPIVPASHLSETITSELKNENAPLILIAEDNEELRFFLIESLEKKYRVIDADDGLKAWDLTLEELPDLIISDVMMPGQDGFDFCKICKSDNRTAHIGFLLLTSKAAHEARLQGLEQGADDYITKPFNLSELELRIANLLRLQAKQREWLQAQIITPEPAVSSPEITNPFLIQLYAEMDAKLDDPDLGVDFLCKVMAMSRSTLNRKLKSLLNLTTNEVIRQYRLQKASQLILSGIDISTAAYQTGFSSPSYFSQCFKEQYNLTPSDWLSRQN